MPARKPDAYWHVTWNPAGGCFPIAPGCRPCYAATDCATWLPTGPVPIHRILYGGTTVTVRGRHAFNGKVTTLPPGHPLWTEPLRLEGAGQIIFICDMSDLFYEPRPIAVIGRVLATVASTEHIGLTMTRRTQRAAEFFHEIERRRSPAAVARWKSHLWIGFSAENQKWFDFHWQHMRSLAENGWTVVCSVAPMIGPVQLPPDFLSLGAWVICSGEQGRKRKPRPMKLSWARALRDQCARAGIPFFMKKLHANRPIPPDLHIRQFPKVHT